MKPRKMFDIEFSRVNCTSHTYDEYAYKLTRT